MKFTITREKRVDIVWLHRQSLSVGAISAHLDASRIPL